MNDALAHGWKEKLAVSSLDSLIGGDERRGASEPRSQLLLQMLQQGKRYGLACFAPLHSIYLPSLPPALPAHISSIRLGYTIGLLYIRV
eukprot:scaffold335_cov142-Skeletonema_menzelii.AAC.7